MHKKKERKKPHWHQNYAHLFCLFVSTIFLPINNFSHVWTNSCLQPLLLADKVSCPVIQHYDSGDSQISNPSVPSLTLYQLRNCASYALTSFNFVNMTSWVRGLPFFSLDETQEQHIGHYESARRMLLRAFALF